MTQDHEFWGEFIKHYVGTVIIMTIAFSITSRRDFGDTVIFVGFVAIFTSLMNANATKTDSRAIVFRNRSNFLRDLKVEASRLWFTKLAHETEDSLIYTITPILPWLNDTLTIKLQADSATLIGPSGILKRLEKKLQNAGYY